MLTPRGSPVVLELAGRTIIERVDMELQDFDIHLERGFLPVSDPAKSLDPEFAAWEELAGELPKLLAAGRVRQVCNRLPVLALPVTEPAQRRAMMLLSFLGHAYVWGDGDIADSVPAGLAVPWCQVAALLGRPPVLSYASYALDNWRRLDPAAPIELGNLALLQNFLGGIDEEWFVLVHVDIEARAADAIAALFLAVRAARDGNVGQLESCLVVVRDSLDRMQATLERMPEHCDPYIYFHRVRPYIHGWKDHPALARGLMYEGVEAFHGQPQQFRGETGAQSAIVPALDAALGISHADDPLGSYLRDMRNYIPPNHRQFLAHLEATSQVRTVVRQGALELRRTYNDCVDRLARFRGLHLEYAARYVQQQSRGSQRNPSSVGTGGTPFMRYLDKHRAETLRHILPT